MITREKINNLPSTFGVYIFKKKDQVLYIGKSINIRARVKSHLENAKLDRKESLIVENSDHIESIIVENEFQSLILEPQLIKKYRPKYNVVWKDDKSYLYIKVTIKDNYPKLLLSRRENDHRSLYFGPFSSVKVVESLINDIRHIISFCTQKNLSKNACFYSKINLCNPCPNFINQIKDETMKKKLKKVYRKNIKKVVKILNGGVTVILDGLYRQLKVLAERKNYEEAIKIRNKIYRLERLINHPISEIGVINELSLKTNNKLKVFLQEINKYFSGIDDLKRIETYDISNLKESNQVGSMVVLSGGKLDKKEYRRFRIKNQSLRSDFDRLEEIITRRFKTDWPYPNLIVVDGGRPQVKTAIKTLGKIKIAIPVLGIAKNPDRLVIGVNNYPTIRFPQTNPAFNIIRLIRDESHRFAKKYHLHLRKMDFLV
ncbi:MAG: GIY-YIG nuclease family protein [Candidatus Roizmanbacteria bacterium]